MRKSSLLANILVASAFGLVIGTLPPQPAPYTGTPIGGWVGSDAVPDRDNTLDPAWQDLRHPESFPGCVADSSSTSFDDRVVIWEDGREERLSFGWLWNHRNLHYWIVGVCADETS